MDEGDTLGATTLDDSAAGSAGSVASSVAGSAAESAGSEQLRELLARGEGRLGPFRVLDKLGEGAMGIVLAAHDERLDRQVALKFLTRANHDARARERLVREARSLARLSHPNIVAVHEVGEAEGMPYLVMELIPGQTLRSWLEGEGIAGPSRLDILRMFLDVGRGLLAAHELDVVHRDFKPDNVLVGEDGRPRVVDFGLARIAGDTPERAAKPAGAHELAGSSTSLTATGAIMGTPAFMAPEQWAGLPADARSDQFAFCVALFRAVYGRVPFEADTAPALMQAVVEREPATVPTADQLPGPIHRALLRGLAKSPDARWPSMSPLLEQLEHALATAQPGLFGGPPPLIARVLAPLFMSIPLVWLGVELAGVVDYTPRNWAWLSGVQIALLIALVLGLRSRLRHLVGDPRVFGTPLLIGLFILGHRAIALITGSSLEVLFAYDFLAAVGIASIMAFLVDRRVWPVAVFNLTLAVLATARPSWGPRLWAVFCLGLPSLVFLGVRRNRDRLRGEAGSTTTGRSQPSGS